MYKYGYTIYYLTRIGAKCVRFVKAKANINIFNVQDCNIQTKLQKAPQK